jgi:hypothetical protein
MKAFWIALGVTVVLVLSVVWMETTAPEKSARSQALPCQQEVTTFDRWRVEAPQREAAQQKLQAGNYTLSGQQHYAEYMQSALEGVLTGEEVEALLVEAVGAAPASDEAPLQIRWDLYEDDKADPKKRNPPKTAFSGYLLLSFVDGGQEVYRIQIDYLEADASDLGRRAACAIASFLAG